MAIKLESNHNTSISLTIYTNNLALINEIRSLPKAKDNCIVEYNDISRELIESSLEVVTGNVNEINFNYKCCDKEEHNYRCNECTNHDVSSFNIEFNSLNCKYIQVYYLTKGVQWNNSYTIVLDKDTLCLESWVNIINKSGINYDNAILKVVAGEINNPYNEGITPLRLSSNMAIQEKAVIQGELEDYYIYNIRGKYNLKNNSFKRIKDFAITDISYNKYYDFQYRDENASIIIEFENKESNNLGMALPAGIVNVYSSVNNDLELIGNGVMKNTPVNEIVYLNIGKAFDVISKTSIIDDTILENYRVREIEIIIINGKDEEIKSNICYPIFEPWEMDYSTDNFTRNKDGNPCFSVSVKANDKKVIRFIYKVRVRD